MLRSHLVLALTLAGEIVATAGWIAVPEEPGTGRIRKVFVHPRCSRSGHTSLVLLSHPSQLPEPLRYEDAFSVHRSITHGGRKLLTLRSQLNQLFGLRRYQSKSP